MSTANRRPPTKLSLEDWDRMQWAYEKGETVVSLSKMFTVSRPTIEKRARVFGWKRPGGMWIRKGGNRGATAPESPAPNGSPGTTATKLQEASGLQMQVSDDKEALVTKNYQPPGSAGVIQISDVLERLQALSAEPPEAYQTGIVQIFQGLISQGLTQLKAPENWNEMKTAFTLFRQASGLDRPDKTEGAGTTVHPMRTLKRRQLGTESINEAEVVSNDQLSPEAEAPEAPPGPPEAGSPALPEAQDDEDDGLGSAP